MTAHFGSLMPSSMHLYDAKNDRLYLNAAERMRFLKVAQRRPRHIRAFCLVLFYTGCRISEALELRFSSIQPQARLISFRSLKKRDQHHIREVPVPPEVIEALAVLPRHVPRAIWTVKAKPLPRITAYRKPLPKAYATAMASTQSDQVFNSICSKSGWDMRVCPPRPSMPMQWDRKS